jgi:saccharopine dehydrogenase-like NADP-dependent oxidoreductase
MYTLHSEVATLPLSFQNKGVKEVSFKIAFDPEFIEKVQFLRDLGMASHDYIDVDGVRVRPITLLSKVALSQTQGQVKGKLKQYEIVRTIVKEIKNGKKLTVVSDCHIQGMPEWGLGSDISTGSPPSVVAQMIAGGEIAHHGVVPPEIAVPTKSFFSQLKRRKMFVKVVRQAGWRFLT